MPVQREDMKARSAELQLQGATLPQIVAALIAEGYPEVTTQTISNLLAQVMAQYKETALKDKTTHINERLAALAKIRWEAWQQFEKSKQDAERRLNETLTGGEHGGYTKEQFVTEGRIAQKAYLDVVMDTWRDETELLGYKPPPPAANVSIANVLGVDWAALTGRPTEPDPLKARIEAVNVLPPRDVPDPAEPGPLA